MGLVLAANKLGVIVLTAWFNSLGWPDTITDRLLMSGRLQLRPAVATAV